MIGSTCGACAQKTRQRPPPSAFARVVATDLLGAQKQCSKTLHTMRSSKVCLLVLLVVGPALGRAFEWQPCADVTTTAQTIQEVTLSPDPVPVGSTATFKIHGVSSKPQPGTDKTVNLLRLRRLWA